MVRAAHCCGPAADHCWEGADAADKRPCRMQLQELYAVFVCWRSLQLEVAEVDAPRVAGCSTSQCMQGQPTAAGVGCVQPPETHLMQLPCARERETCDDPTHALLNTRLTITHTQSQLF